jgi:hypothetical protein
MVAKAMPAGPAWPGENWKSHLRTAQKECRNAQGWRNLDISDSVRPIRLRLAFTQLLIGQIENLGLNCPHRPALHTLCVPAL